MAYPETHLQIDLMNLCKKYNLVEYVFVAWSADDTIKILSNSEDGQTQPFCAIELFATKIAEQVQQDSKNRMQ